MNIFNAVHETREGIRMPIVSMGSDHLVHTVNLFCRKGPQEFMETARKRVSTGLARDNMSEKQARAMGLKIPTAEDLEYIENTLRTGEIEAYQRGLEKAIPYIIVGVCRDDTRDGVVAILQDVTDIKGRLAAEAEHLLPLPTEEDDMFLEDFDELRSFDW